MGIRNNRIKENKRWLYTPLTCACAPTGALVSMVFAGKYVSNLLILICVGAAGYLVFGIIENITGKALFPALPDEPDDSNKPAN